MKNAALKKRMSSGAKWGVGCGIGCLALVVIMAIAAVIGVRFLKSRLDAVTGELEQLGFENVVKRQVVEISDEITEPTMCVAQMVKILGNCSTNLAIVAQVAEIHGKVDGKVYFRGQMLTIQPHAELLGDLDVVAQVIQKHGKVHGEITGRYQVIDDGSGK